MESTQPEDKVLNSKVLDLDGPKEGETEKEAYRRRLMNSFKSGVNVETQRLAEEKAARQKDQKEATSDLPNIGEIRVFNKVDPKDLKPNPFKNSAENSLGADETEGERRSDYDPLKNSK